MYNNNLQENKRSPCIKHRPLNFIKISWSYFFTGPILVLRTELPSIKPVAATGVTSKKIYMLASAPVNIYILYMDLLL